ncbi:ABC transporter [Putridiphycobacter roseus]|uniref:ABC transporter n=1 Tax=Putridiphycobacter roseus TaxID=2219161 RepID=A0A2W1NN79_9FLAO|nr:ABC transporter ATP-binding protein [Putridiphycobacter roseus]PZE16028.1 ABC transporter [Putridiphycobacter roseus]
MSSLYYLNKFLFKYKRYLLLGILFIFISNVFGVMMPGVVKDTINDLVSSDLTNGDVSLGAILKIALMSAGLYVFYSVLKGIFLFYTRQTIIKMSRYIEYDLKNEVYDQYQKLSFNFYKKNATGDLMNRISEDVSKVRMYLGPGIMYTINLVIMSGLIIFVMLRVSPILTLYVLAPLPVMSVLIYFVSFKLNKKSNLVQSEQSKLSTFVQENFSGIRVIKSYIREKESIKNFNTQAVNYKEASLSLAKTSALFMPTIVFLIGLSNIITIYLGILQAREGLINAGEIAQFVIFINMLTWPFASVGWVTSLIQRAAASQARINEFLKETPEIINPSTEKVTFAKEIVFKNVGLVYENSGVRALTDVNFQIKKGETIGVIGKTGSGKSSLAYLLLRLLDPTEGSIKIDGKNLNELNIDSWRDLIGYVPQEHFLFSDSIRNNITFGLKASDIPDEMVFNAAKSAGIHESILEFPAQYETKLGERGINLSGGQKQRISIARALIKQPEFVIFDDCLSAVDNETEELILNAIQNQLKNSTSFIISHRISSIKYADRILVLDEGKIVESGKHDDLLTLNGAYASIYAKQKLSEEINTL